ncbi:MAG: TIGR04255 family protein [Thermoguttaceae bacterium]
MNTDTSLPDYDNPPVIEVVCGVLFRELEGLRAAYLGKLWDKLRPEYSVVREASPLVPTVEVFGAVPHHQFRLTDVPPLARTWLMTASENGIVQIQRDRFLHNWKKVTPRDEYPRYSKVIQMFWDHLRTFSEFLEEFQIGSIEPLQYEMTYVNHIPLGDGWHSLDEIGNVFPDFAWRQAEGRFLPTPDQVNWRTSFLMPEKKGRLHTIVRQAQRPCDKRLMLLFELTARGFPGDPALEARREWFELAHQWIVRGFTDLTSPSVRENVWRQTR